MTIAQARWWPRGAIQVSLVAAVVIAGCDLAPSGMPTLPKVPTTADESFRSYNLTIYGYNYSDSGISTFEVNGQGGGNLGVSTPSAGGAKHVCCTSVYSPLPAPQAVTIKWTRDMKTWCQQVVMLKPPLPAKPEYFEVHFYPDGHIEVAVTEEASRPRLVLERDSPGSRHADEAMNVNNDAKYGSCKHGYE